MSRFKPDAAQASSLRRAMERALWDSVAHVLAADGEEQDRFERCTPTRRATLLDFGAYFDLVLTPPTGEAVSDEVKAAAALHLTDRLQTGEGRPAQPAPRIVNFAPPFFNASEIDRLSRWWDIEPENAIALAGLGHADFVAVTGLIEHALAKLALACPHLHGEVTAIVETIVLARPDGSQRFEFGGATSFALWGALALNAQAHECWEQCYQTIVHETGHNLLFAIARDQPLVADDPAVLRGSPLRDQLRPLDGIYHAAFVSAREAIALDRLLVRHEIAACLTDAEASRIEVLLEGSVTAFWRCVETLRAQAHLTDLGEEVLSDCEVAMRASFSLLPV